MSQPAEGSHVPPWQDITDRQCGVIARRQLIELGLPPGLGRSRVRSGHWRRLMPGVYATFTGPLPVMTRLWALLLHCGPDAVIGGQAALWLAGVRDQPPSVVQVCVPHGVRPVARSGLVVCGRRHLEALRHPATLPPRLRVEEAVLDVADACSKPAGVVDVMLCVVQRRLTSPDRLAERLSARHRHRWRDLIEDVLADARDGTQSLLERSYLNGVERAHGLPTGVQNAPDQVSPGGARCYRDVRYRRWAVVVELDGLEAHPAERAFRDRARDNAAVVSGQVSLRYGWREVAGDPCGIASELCRVLRRRGWDGKARPCGPDCTLEVDDRWGSVPDPDADPHR